MTTRRRTASVRRASAMSRCSRSDAIWPVPRTSAATKTPKHQPSVFSSQVRRAASASVRSAPWNSLTVVLRGVAQVRAPPGPGRRSRPGPATWNCGSNGGQPGRVVPDEREHALPGRLEPRVAQRDQAAQLPHPPVALEPDISLLPDVIEVKSATFSIEHIAANACRVERHPEVAHGAEPRGHPDALDLLDLAREELALSAPHRSRADAAAREAGTCRPAAPVGERSARAPSALRAARPQSGP